MDILPPVATELEAADNEAVWVNCEMALDETTEKLQAYFENSSSWLETALLTMGFYLLSIAAKAPEEFELHGVKINVSGDYRELFLFLIGMALVFRLVQGWITWKLNVYRIDRSFEKVSSRLGAAKGMLLARVHENEKLMHGLLEEFTRERQLPDPHELFADDGIYSRMDASKNFGQVLLTADNFRQALADQILLRRNDLVSRQLDDRYPLDVWNRAAEAAIAESMARHAVYFSPQVAISVFSKTEEAAPTISSDERIKLMQAREAAFKSLRTAMVKQSATAQNQLDGSTERLNGFVVRIRKVHGKLKFYRLVAKGGHFLHLALPTIAAILAAGAMVFNRY